MRLLTLGIVVLICGFNSMAQDVILLKNGDYKTEQNVESFIANPDFQKAELVNGFYFRVIQFESTPSASDKEDLMTAGIELFDYLPYKAFYASISTTANLNVLVDKKAKSIVQLDGSFKLSTDLFQNKYPEWALVGTDKIELTAIHFPSITEEEAVRSLEAKGANITMKSGARLLSFIIELSKIDELVASPAFYFIESVSPPEVPEDYKDVSNHRSNYINNPVGIGTSYSGKGVTVMMQDDGIIGPHIDYQGRITTSVSGNGGNHGDHVAGIIMGAGNLDPDLVGNAPGAHLLVYSSQNSEYNIVPNLVLNDSLVITSKSYGNGNNAGYTSLSMQLDEQCNDYDALVHVFSAGNSGTSDFGYGAGAGWGNITGGHKQGKNVLAVGNLTITDVLSSSSSRGPADDGRIKPDICGVGSSVNSTIDPNTYDIKSGTSMSCPGVAGSLALLYEAYRDLNGGQNPSASLMHGAILNTAQDLGNPGPDFKFGWGRINVRRAYQLIEDQNYRFSTIWDGQIEGHTISVPAGTQQLRVMIYWTDYQASPAAPLALVNDINMTLTSPDATVYQPWVLNSTPNAGLLDMDAQPGIDNLNNVEQITIDYPIAGPYNVSIEGFNIPQGPQNYVVVYEFVQDEVVLTFPIGGESVRAGSSELIRWDAVGDIDNFIIDYTTDDGQTWNAITGGIPGAWRSYPWTVPSSVISGKARVRITRGTQVTESKSNFSIIQRPINLNVEWACPQSFNFSWNPVPGAIGYEVFLLGDKYMDSVGYTTQTNATVYANSLQPQWYSVRAIGPDNCLGKRALAVYKGPSVSACTISSPVAGFSSICNEVGPGSCIQFMDNSLNAGQGAAWEWTFPGGTPATSTQENPVICYSASGWYDVSLTVKNGVGEDSVSIAQYVYIRPGDPLPFQEDFESGFIPANWNLDTNGTATNWMIDNSVSAYNYGEAAIQYDNFSNTDSASMSRISTQQINLSSLSAIMELSFDVAYAKGMNQSDSLKVYITNDCGSTEFLLYSSGGDALATADQTAALFVPKTTEWRDEAISLPDYRYWTSASFIFENYSGNGNVLYLDNINLKVSEDNFSSDLISTFPNPFNSELNIAGLVEGEATTIRIHSANGQLVYENTFDAIGGTMTLNTDLLADGMYTIRIVSDSKTHKTKLIKLDE